MLLHNSHNFLERNSSACDEIWHTRLIFIHVDETIMVLTIVAQNEKFVFEIY